MCVCMHVHAYAVMFIAHIIMHMHACMHVSYMCFASMLHACYINHALNMHTTSLHHACLANMHVHAMQHACSMHHISSRDTPVITMRNAAV